MDQLRNQRPLVNVNRLMQARWAFGLAIVLTLASMLRYPGGTTLVRASERYSLDQNFLSDLGMTIAYNGEPNCLGALCFVAGLLLVLAGVSAILIEFVRICSASARARTLVRAGCVSALCACLAFVGVAFTPENRAMAAHIDFTFLGFRIAPAATLLLALAAYAARLPRSITAILTLLTTALVAFAAILQWGPTLANPSGLRFQVLAQKAAVGFALVAFFAMSLALAHESRR